MSDTPSKPNPAAPAGDALTLEIAGRQFGGWQGVRVGRGMERFPGYFILRVTERLPDSPLLIPITRNYLVASVTRSSGMPYAAACELPVSIANRGASYVPGSIEPGPGTGRV